MRRSDKVMMTSLLPPLGTAGIKVESRGEFSKLKAGGSKVLRYIWSGR